MSKSLVVLACIAMLQYQTNENKSKIKTLEDTVIGSTEICKVVKEHPQKNMRVMDCIKNE